MKEGTFTLQAQDDVFEEQHSQGIEKVVQAAKMQEEIDEHSQELAKQELIVSQLVQKKREQNQNELAQAQDAII